MDRADLNLADAIAPQADSSPVNEYFNMDVTEDEISQFIGNLKNNKACGIDLIRNEFLKNCPPKVVSLITNLFNHVLNTGIIPTDWCIGLIVPLYKDKGSRHDPDNYRGISTLLIALASFSLPS